jgi:hypothetical protein
LVGVDHQYVRSGSVVFNVDTALWEGSRLVSRIREDLATPVPRFLGSERRESNWCIMRDALRTLQRAQMHMATDMLHLHVTHLLNFPFVKQVFVSFDSGALPEEVKDFFIFTPVLLSAQVGLYTEHIKRCATIAGPAQLELRFIRKFLKICGKIRAFAGVMQLGCFMTKNVSFHAVWSAIEAAHRGPVIV